MKYKTKQQRAELYLFAAQVIHTKDLSSLVPKSKYDFSFIDSKYCCDVIGGLSNLKHHIQVTEELFPEFFMFKPQITEGFTGWWQEDDLESRIISLLLASEIARHP